MSRSAMSSAPAGHTLTALVTWQNKTADGSRSENRPMVHFTHLYVMLISLAYDCDIRDVVEEERKGERERENRSFSLPLPP